MHANERALRRLFCAVSAIALAGYGAPAAAQSAAAEAEVDELVVTGRFQNSLVNRLPTDPEEAPFTVNTIDAATLAERGFFNPLDALELVPNVVRRQTQLLPGGGTYLIRGLTATVLTNNRPENDSRGAGRRDVSQIDRIEVLKGPASILLGPVIPGGVVNQVTKSPKDEDFLVLTGRVGSYGTWRAEADGNVGSLLGSDKLRGRVTLAIEDQQSPQDPEHTKTKTIRPVIEADLSERTRVQASVSYTDRKGVPGSAFAVNADGTVPAMFDEKTFFGVPARQEGKDVYVDAELQHEFLDDLKLVLRGSYQDTNFDYWTSHGASNYAGGRGFTASDMIAFVYQSYGYRDTNVAYADAQLVGGFEAFGQRQDWVVGATGQWTKFDNYWASGGTLAQVDINNIAGAVYPTPNFSYPLRPFVDQETTLSSVYGEANIRPTGRLTIVAGARYDEYELKNLIASTKTKTDDVTFRIGGTFAFSDQINGYVSYAESFIPQTGMMRNGSSIDPEEATNYEVGLRAQLLQGRLKLTAAAFTLTRQNVATADPANVPGGPSYVVATGEQEHKGYELSADLTPAPGLSLNLAYGYVDAKITKVINIGNGEAVGDPVALTPKHTFSAFGAYTVQNGPLAGLKLGLGVRGISDRPAPRFRINYGGYTLVDAMVAYPFSDTLDVQLNVHNLLNEEYRDNVGFASGTAGSGHRFGNPRTAYLTVRSRF